MASTRRLKWAVAIFQKKGLASQATSGTFKLWTAQTTSKPPKILAPSLNNPTAMMSKPAATAIGGGIFTMVALEGTLIAHEQANTPRKNEKVKGKKLKRKSV